MAASIEVRPSTFGPCEMPAALQERDFQQRHAHNFTASAERTSITKKPTERISWAVSLAKYVQALSSAVLAQQESLRASSCQDSLGFNCPGGVSAARTPACPPCPDYDRLRVSACRSN